ncbi:MAG: hypothetical protein WC382_12365 [Methanoregulaceae archaeon]|jgi:hypothetical protein
MVLKRKKPDLPDITYDEANVLGWLKKRDCISDLSECERYCYCENFEIDLKAFQKKVGSEKVRLYRTPIAKSKHVIFIQNSSWADAWALYYDVEFPHHRQRKRYHPRKSKK